jgi:hypothetical protein
MNEEAPKFKLLLKRARKCEAVRCRDATTSSFVAKVRGEDFANVTSVAVNVKRHSSNPIGLFGMPGRIALMLFHREAALARYTTLSKRA